MPTRLIIPGQPIEKPRRAAARGAVPDAAEAKPATDLLSAVQELGAFSLSPAARARGAAQPLSMEVEDDDILQLEVEGGFTLWTSVKRYREQLAELKPESVKDGIVTVDVLPRPGIGAERGIREWSGAALRVLRLGADRILADRDDPGRWPDWVKDFGVSKAEQLGAWLATKFLTWLIEEKGLKTGAGLYQWRDPPEEAAGGPSQPRLVTPENIPGDRPILVFVHGTASSTGGSFGALTGAEAKPHWREIRRRFDEHIYAFEHRTLSQSPVENAIALAKALPRGARINLVSHSRGGMVGDLLCLKGIPPEEFGRYGRRDPDLEQADEHDRKCLQVLGGELRDRQFRIERFARVACPARGTLLASENIDQFLSILTNLVGLVPGLAGSPVYEVVKRVTLEVVKNRLRPELLPGIEAMVPSSPLVALLNSAPAGGALGVIAGDIEGGSWLKRLGTFITDAFIYENRENDLVVNTDSMFQGAPRESAARYVFDQGADVSHFNYFRNQRTRAAMLHWLDPDAGPASEFRELEEAQADAPVPMLRSIQTRSGADQPVAFVVPGLMGSHLSVAGVTVWPRRDALMKGGIGQLGAIGAPGVEAPSLVGSYYAALCKYLGDSHEVVPFAYDWRRSIRNAARDLAVAVEAALKRSKQPVRLVAHDMGGLVLRRMIADQPKLWERVCERDGARVVMLGTPNHGSHAVAELLLGEARTVRQLALLDRDHSPVRIAEILAGFPGILECLPDEFLQEDAWQGVRTARAGGAFPDPRALASARAARADLAKIPHADKVVHCVAGKAPATLCQIAVEAGAAGPRLVFHATSQGDGRVTHQSAGLADAARWYADVEHGELPDHRPMFPAIAELLQQGATGRFTSAPPAAARAGGSTVRYFPEPVLYPTEGDLVAGLMGRRTRSYRKKPARGLRVEVVHGDLREARFPLMVGHYEGDTIAGAERALDRRLDGALEERYQLGLYPGPLRSSVVCFRQPGELHRALDVSRGAVVIGLGRWGELTPDTLARAVRDGTLQYLLQLSDRGGCGPNSSPAPAGEMRGEGAGLSALLIGYNSNANMAVEDSVNAILRGVLQANRDLDERPGGCAKVCTLQIVELYSDIAIETARAARRAAQAIKRDLGVEVDAAEQLHQRPSGERRLTQTANRDYWRRWEISALQDDRPTPALALPEPLARRLKESLADPATVDEETLKAVTDLALSARTPALRPPRVLKFLTLSDRARAEVKKEEHQPELIEQHVREIIARTDFRAETAATLFDLMFPNELKDSLAQQSRVVFVLDAETSEYPWELMVDGGEPLCVRIGMVRQLQTATYLQQVRAATAQTALVVGNPLAPERYPSLQGASDEARLVATTLGKRFDVSYRDERLSASEVFEGLFAKPYRVLHLAGHGDYRAAGPDGGARTGMVLDGGVFLTAAEIAKMRQVPDLVFLNCCHLARIGGEAPAAGTPVAFNKLAASISRELIEMGVRAVVAAGWAVRDDAAHCFARKFYDSMLGGEAFGRALKLARQETWRNYSESNTWGAYQAYGDPDFRLFPGDERQQSYEEFVAPEELFVELDSIVRRSKASTGPGFETPGGKKGAPPGEDPVARLYQASPPEWRGRALVLARFGDAYRELEDFEAAIRFYRLALEMDELGSSLTLRVVENLGNLEARLGRDQNDAGRIRVAIGRIETLLQIAETSERLSLLGSAYKCLAQTLADAAEIRAALEKSAGFYQRAYERKAARGDFDLYPQLNWLTNVALLGSPVPGADAAVEQGRATAREQFDRSPSFWAAVAVPDLEGIQSLLSGKAPDPDKVVRMYREAQKETGASPREMKSVVDQIRFVVSMLGKLDGAGERPSSREMVAAFTRIHEHLAPEAGPTAGPGARPGAPETDSPQPGKARTGGKPAAKKERAKGARRKNP